MIVLSPFEQVVAAALAAIALVAAMVSSRPRYAAKAVMTPNEAEFFHRLSRAMPTGYVFVQVAMSALLEPRGMRPGSRLSAFRRISQKRVDYAVHDAKLNLVCVVELDDRTHVQAHDKARDALLRSAGIVTLRWSSTRKPTVTEIRSALARLPHGGSKAKGALR